MSAAQPVAKTTPLPFRADTILGVCEALGEDFGIHANWFRLAFAGAFYWGPTVAIGAYLALGLVIALSRYLFPRPLSVAAVAAQVPAAAVTADQRELPLAA